MFRLFNDVLPTLIMLAVFGVLALVVAKHVEQHRSTKYVSVAIGR